jgi:hypothetical protein
MYTITNEQFEVMNKLVKWKVNKESHRMKSGFHKNFREDDLRTFLFDHTWKEVEKFNKGGKGDNLEKYLYTTLNSDFLDFIRVSKNTNNNLSLNQLQEQFGDSFVTELEDIGGSLSNEDNYFEDTDDGELQILSDWECETLEEAKESIESLDLTYMDDSFFNKLDKEYSKINKLISLKASKQVKIA